MSLAERLAACSVTEIAWPTRSAAVPADVTSGYRRALMPAPRARYNTRNTGTPTAWPRRTPARADASLAASEAALLLATGNIATEDLVASSNPSGIGASTRRLIAASDWLGEQLGRPTPALVSKAGGFPKGVDAA
jgi:hydroxymethylglutaryl-CoA lyase